MKKRNIFCYKLSSERLNLYTFHVTSNFSYYIALYEVCHTPVQMKKRNIYCYKLSSERLNLLLMLHRTVCVPPASSDEKTQHIFLQII